ncbi:MAG: hypothetical protein HW394_688 [Acidobacteria bacterium]|nr:hypothetical protein [Acidobacteriota bacterium]
MLTLVGRGFTPRQAGRKGPPYVNTREYRV